LEEVDMPLALSLRVVLGVMGLWSFSAAFILIWVCGWCIGGGDERAVLGGDGTVSLLIVEPLEIPFWRSDAEASISMMCGWVEVLVVDNEWAVLGGDKTASLLVIEPLDGAVLAVRCRGVHSDMSVSLVGEFGVLVVC
jgi:hypothetical protein